MSEGTVNDAFVVVRGDPMEFSVDFSRRQKAIIA